MLVIEHHTCNQTQPQPVDAVHSLVMSDQEDGRRLRRRRGGNNAAMPSATHYVGYVEEDETPEMIMKKFEELEKVSTGLASRFKRVYELPDQHLV